MKALFLFVAVGLGTVSYAAEQVYTEFVGPLKVVTFTKTSAYTSHPSVELVVPRGFKIIGGGAKVNWSGAGNLLTASFPKNERTWVAKSKDHSSVSPATITAFAIAVKMVDGTPIPSYAYRISSRTSRYTSHPQASVGAGHGYALVGGGASVNWRGAGNLLVSSYPTGNTWVAQSKDHSHVSPATITVYAIGLDRSFLEQFAVDTERTTASSFVASHPRVSCDLPNGIVTSGGAYNEIGPIGSLLTKSFPSSPYSWQVESKDHSHIDPRSITAYCLGLVETVLDGDRLDPWGF